MKTIPATLNISRPQYGDGRKKIEVSIRCALSGIEFVSMQIDPAEFAEALTGLSRRPGEAEIHGLEYVGKERVTEQRQIICPLKSYKRDDLENWLQENAQEEGWLLNTYLGSQSSVSRQSDGTILRYSVTKYVEP